MDRSGSGDRPRRASGRLLALCVALLAMGALTWWMAREQSSRDAVATSATAAMPSATDESEPPPLPEARSRESEVGALTPTQGNDAATSPRTAAGVIVGTLLGRVVRPDCSPVSDADVIVAAHDQQMRGKIVALRETRRRGVLVDASRFTGRLQGVALQSRTDPAGRFRIELDAQQVIALSYPLVGVISGLTDVAVHRGTPISAGENSLGDIVLPTGAQLRLRLIDPDGNPVVGGSGSVRMMSREVGADPSNDGSLSALRVWLKHCSSADDGVIDLGGLAAGEASIKVETEQWQDLRVDGLELTAGALTDLGDVTLDAGGSIEGVAIDLEGQPVTRVQVGVNAEQVPGVLRRDALELSGREHNWATLDDQGRFRASGLGAGTYTLELFVPGYTTARVTGVASGRRDVRLLLQRPAVVMLTLLDERSGEPVEGAAFTGSVPEDLGPSPAGQLQLAVTSGASAGLAAGLYRIAGASEHGTRICAQVEGYPSQTIDVPGLAPESTLSVTLRLDRGFILGGQVVDFENRPIVGADVQAALCEGSGFRGETRRVPTGAEGRFRFAGSAAGTWSVWVTAPEFLSAPGAEVQVVQGDVDDVLFRLAPAASIEGRVFAPTGEPLPEAVVVPALVETLPAPCRTARSARVLIESSLDTRPGTGSCSEAGAYRLSGLAPGVFLIRASTLDAELVGTRLRALAADARDPAFVLPADVVRVTLGLGEHRALDLVVPRLASLSGHVRSTGDSAIDAKVGVWLAQGERWAAVAQAGCDEAGAYTIEGLPAGDVIVVAIADAEPLPREARLTLTEGQSAQCDLVFGGVSARGLVVDAESRQAIAGVPVSLTWRSPGPPAEAPHDLSQETWEALSVGSLHRAALISDATGRVALPHLVAGEYQLALESRDWLATSAPKSVTIDESWTGEELVLEVSAGAVVEGAVRFALGGIAGLGSDDYDIGLYTPGENIVHASTRVRDGTYRLQGLHGGSYELRVLDRRRGGGPLQSQAVTLKDDEHQRIDVTLGQ